MNTEELAKLSDEQKRIRIAELCGWTQIVNANTMAMGGMWRGYPPTGQVIGRKDLLPAYPADLNAMHEAEKIMTDFQLQTFGEQLQEIVNYYCVGVVPDYHRHLMCLAKIAHATAAQRADAFLLTMA